MRTFFSLIHIAMCILLPVAVLLQQRKQGGFGGAFGGGTQAETKQWQRFTGLTKLTVALAGCFMLTSILLVLM